LTKYNDTGLTEGGNVQYQPLGARYYILSGGTSLAGNVFIPNGIVCNFYLNDEGQKLITGATAGNDYIIAVSMMGGLGDDQNLPSGGWPCN